MRALVTTTINDPVALDAWATQMESDDVFVIAGDLKTPHAALLERLDRIRHSFVYVHPDEPTDWHSECAGYNVIQRRNLATLEALRLNPDYVVFIDDDNVPFGDTHYFRRANAILLAQDVKERLIWSPTGWYNVYREIGRADVGHYNHRGYPHWLWHEEHDALPIRTRYGHPRRIGVIASAVLGDPDVDAVERITRRPTSHGITGDVVLEAGTWHPFNSQATAVRRELVPFMHMWLGVGRFDDIWASYLMRVIMDVFGWHVHHGTPVVYQVRNEHDLNVDLQNELFGYIHNEVVTVTLRKIAVDLEQAVIADPSSWDAPRLMQFIVDRIGVYWLPAQTLLGMRAWIADLEHLRDKYDVEFAPLEVKP